jgi:hypothetical protein
MGRSVEIVAIILFGDETYSADARRTRAPQLRRNDDPSVFTDDGGIPALCPEAFVPFSGWASLRRCMVGWSGR